MFTQCSHRAMLTGHPKHSRRALFLKRIVAVVDIGRPVIDQKLTKSQRLSSIAVWMA